MCLRLVQGLGLEFGAIDLIRTPDGRYVFLEVNGNGQFLWAEELSGVKVSEALADLLAGVAPSLQGTQL
jgi:glutathione synthase/RimK-type ligase-like ATP-grasp enzyme